MPEEVPHFVPPEIQNNPSGWGPCEMPDQFKDMPYQPFSKGDRIGKVRIQYLLMVKFVLFPWLIVILFLDFGLDWSVARQKILE